MSRTVSRKVLCPEDGDPQTAELVSQGRTIGCFQIESPGMRSLLRMLRCRNRLDVIHALSLIRPGPSGSGMKERFIRRRLGEEPTTYTHPNLEPVLKETYGVMLFQEDVLKVAQVIAGFSLEEGDALRKAISKERSPERVAALRERFVAGAAGNGVAADVADEIWRQIQNFAGYSYCKAHAVTYGYISWQAAWMKAHHPAEFMAAVMANGGGFYDTREYCEEARRLGVRILPPDIMLSGIAHSGSAGELRIGLAQVKGITERALRSILTAREKRPFTGLDDFFFRTQVNESEAEHLILCGALDRFGQPRPVMMWRLRLLCREVSGQSSGHNTFRPSRKVLCPEDSATTGTQYFPRRPESFVSRSSLSRHPEIGRTHRDTNSGTHRDATLSRNTHRDTKLSETSGKYCVPDRIPESNVSRTVFRTVSPELFPEPSVVAPARVPDLPEFSIEKRIALEQEVLDLAVTAHPLSLYEPQIAERRFVPSNRLEEHVGRDVTVVGWLVTTRRAVTRKHEYMKFLTLEDRFGTMEVVLFPDAYRQFGQRVTDSGPYVVRGRVEANHRSVGITAAWVDRFEN